MSLEDAFESKEVCPHGSQIAKKLDVGVIQKILDIETSPDGKPNAD
jgi:hypothetical protein